MDQAKQAINAVKVYKSGLSGKNVNIAILDTGVYGHELLNDKIVCFNDYVGGKTKIYDDNGHGTHVAGIICADRIGMAENARILVFKVLDQFGMGKTGDSLRALEWIKRNHKKYDIKILNFSVGYLPDSKLTEKQKILDVIDELWDLGIVVVAAAGNYGPGPFSVTVPGISRKIITVGSYDDFRSGRGPTGCCIVKPEVLAPGSEILSLSNRNNGFVRKSGTSMATPIVAGAIALLLERYPKMKPEEVKLRLYNTCKRIPSQKDRNWGIVDVDKLLGII
nr:S8 family peptidase [uncultured Agathobacter sp.]